MKRHSPAEALLLGLPLIHGKATKFEKQARANLVVAALRAVDGKTTETELEGHWKRMSFGLAGKQGLAQALSDAESLGYVERATGGVILLSSHLDKRTLKDELKASFPKFEKFISEHWGEDYDPGRHHKAFLDAFEHCMERFLVARIEATLSQGAIGGATRESLAHLFGEIAKDFAVHRARDFGDSLIIWMHDRPKDIWPLVRSLLTLVATIQLFDAHNQFGKATRDVLGTTKLVLDTNVVVQLLCPKSSSAWFHSSKSVLDLARRYGSKVVIYESHLQETADVVDAPQRGLQQTDSDWLRMDNQLIQEYSEWLAQGKSLQDFREYLNQFKTHLSNLGISVERQPELDMDDVKRTEDQLHDCLVFGYHDYDRSVRAIGRGIHPAPGTCEMRQPIPIALAAHV